MELVSAATGVALSSGLSGSAVTEAYIHLTARGKTNSAEGDEKHYYIKVEFTGVDPISEGDITITIDDATSESEGVAASSATTPKIAVAEEDPDVTITTTMDTGEAFNTLSAEATDATELEAATVNDDPIEVTLTGTTLKITGIPAETTPALSDTELTKVVDENAAEVDDVMTDGIAAPTSPTTYYLQIKAADNGGTDYYYIAVKVTPKSNENGKGGAVTSVDVALTFSNVSGDNVVKVSQDVISSDAPKSITLKADVTSFDVKMAPLSGTKFDTYPLSIDKVVFSLGTAVVSGEASTDIVVTGIAPATAAQNADMTITISHDYAKSFDIVVKIVVPAKGGDEGVIDDSQGAAIEKATLDTTTVKNLLNTSLTVYDATAITSGDRDASEVTTSKAAAATSADADLGGEGITVSNVQTIALQSMTVEDDGIYVFSIAKLLKESSAIKAGDKLVWYGNGTDSSSESVELVVLTAEIETGKAVFLHDVEGVTADEAVIDEVPSDKEVAVAAHLTKGVTYNPVIATATVTEKEPGDGPTSNNGSGGCDLGLGGVALLLAALLPLAKKR
ncbi:MAG: hypothetical protein IJ702_09335 [Fretibacterium sp.]|nr:hypothetical protein [Fretibacterium sp.]